MIQEILVELKKIKLHKFQTKQVLKDDKSDVMAFIKASAELAWMMVIQRPPMEFQYAKLEQKIVEAEQEASWNSTDPDNPRSRVAFIVYPALYHNQKLMVKGKVCLRAD